jgi:hypothetical protein
LAVFQRQPAFLVDFEVTHAFVAAGVEVWRVGMPAWLAVRQASSASSAGAAFTPFAPVVVA